LSKKRSAIQTFFLQPHILQLNISEYIHEKLYSKPSLTEAFKESVANLLLKSTDSISKSSQPFKSNAKATKSG